MLKALLAVLCLVVSAPAAATFSMEFWFKPLANEAWAFVALNRNAEPRKVSFDWKSEVVRDELSKRALSAQPGGYALHNLWKNTAAGTTRRALEADIPGHDVVMLKLTPG